MTVNDHLALCGYPPIGPHPSGEPFTELSVALDSACQRVERIIGPSAPQQDYTPIVDWEPMGDGEEFPIYGEPVHLSDEQFAEAWREYEAALDRFHRTGGVSFVAGPTEVTAALRTASGSTATAILVGDEWRFVSWSTAK